MFSRLLTLSFLIVSPAIVLAGPSIGQFEIKELEIEVGAIELQSQNAYSFNHPNRTFINDNGDVEFDENEYVKQRHALEIEISPTHFMRTRIGIEFEKERFDDPETLAEATSYDRLKLSEIAFETIVVLQAPTEKQLGIGLLAEFELAAQAEDDSKSITFGPILQYHINNWQLSSNLYGVYNIDGEDQGKWDFSYASRILYQQNPQWSVAIEAYGTIDRLGNSGEIRSPLGDHDQHRLGPIIYYAINTDWQPKSGFNPATDEEQESSLSIGIGWFFGLNDNTPEHTLKWSIEYEF